MHSVDASQMATCLEKKLLIITKTYRCNICRDFSAVKIEKFQWGKKMREAVLTSTHNLCFGAKLEK